MNELKSIAANIPLLPEWAQLVALHLFGVYVILQLVHLIIKKLQTPELRTAIAALKSLSGEALRKAGRSLELPVERPRLALIGLVLNAALYYVFALIFFAYFGVFLMLGAAAPDIALFKRLIAFGVSGFFVIASRWYYASAERQRIALVERWKSLRSRSDS